MLTYYGQCFSHMETHIVHSGGPQEELVFLHQVALNKAYVLLRSTKTVDWWPGSNYAGGF